MFGKRLVSMRPTSHTRVRVTGSNEYFPCVGVKLQFSTARGIGISSTTFSTCSFKGKKLAWQWIRSKIKSKHTEWSAHTRVFTVILRKTLLRLGSQFLLGSKRSWGSSTYYVTPRRGDGRNVTVSDRGGGGSSQPLRNVRFLTTNVYQQKRLSLKCFFFLLETKLPFN